MKIPVDRNFVLSAIGLTAALLLGVVALARAITIEPVEPVITPAVGVASEPEIAEAPARVATVPSEGILEMESLALAVDHDPFMPDRTRPASYRLPGDRVEAEAPVRREAPPPPPFRVIGTAVSGEGGIALVEVEETPAPQIVTVGESLFGYRLERVETDAATLVGQGQTVRLAVEQGGQSASGNERNSRNSRNGNAEQAVQRAQEVLEALRSRGMPVEMVEQLMTQQLRGARGGRANVVFDGGRVMVRTRPDTSSVNLPDAPEPR